MESINADTPQKNISKFQNIRYHKVRVPILLALFLNEILNGLNNLLELYTPISPFFPDLLALLVKILIPNAWQEGSLGLAPVVIVLPYFIAYYFVFSLILPIWFGFSDKKESGYFNYIYLLISVVVFVLHLFQLLL